MTVTIQKNGDRLIVYSIHLVAWILFAGLMYATRRLMVPAVSMIETVASTIPYILTFYVSVICYRLLNPQRLGLGILVFLLAFIILSAIAYLYYYWLAPMSGVVLYTTEDIGHFLSQAIWGFIYMFGSATIYHIVPIMIKRERQLRVSENEKLQQQLEISNLREQELKTQKEKLQFENAFIRAQINPHFLHNALNSFIADANEYSPSLSRNMHDLAEILRYAMSSADFANDKVPIAKEIEMLQMLLNIHHMRYPDEYPIQLNIDGKPGLHLVPPMVLLTLVENALKYGVLDDPDNAIKIDLVLREGFFRFTCSNAKVEFEKQNKAHTSNYIGLNNVQYRLDQSFKNRHTFNIEETDKHFTIQLTILEPM